MSFNTKEDRLRTKKEKLAQKIRETLRPLSEKEKADRALSEEFWADPCWSEPLDQ